MYYSKKFKILIVDDNPKNIQVVASILKEEDYSMSFAKDGVSALTMCDENSYDLLLLDVMVPELDGFEVAKTLKANKKTKSIPIIFLTAKTDEESTIKGFESGAVDYITKPFNSLELKARVKTHLKLNDYTKNLIEYKNYLEERIENEYVEKKRKDKILIHQSKMAEMGEMIGAIAHQWRQPLNVLSILAQKIKYDYGFEKIDEPYIDKFLKDFLTQVEFMSGTIEDFKEFFKPDKEFKDFYIKSAISNVLKILDATLKVNDIKVNIKGDDCCANGFENEFKQVILNILTNARDAILTKQEENYFDGAIFIDISLSDDRVCVEIKDNAGGIESDNLSKVFDPYFTTKDTSDGTGIGLYISKIIIEKNMGGELKASNWDLGAKFEIKLKSSFNLRK